MELLRGMQISYDSQVWQWYVLKKMFSISNQAFKDIRDKKVSLKNPPCERKSIFSSSVGSNDLRIFGETFKSGKSLNSFQFRFQFQRRKKNLAAEKFIQLMRFTQHRKILSLSWKKNSRACPKSGKKIFSLSPASIQHLNKLLDKHST